MTTASTTGERRPILNVNASGQPYIRVHTRHGCRTRHVSREGWMWLRAKYPATEYPTVTDIPLTYGDYHEMFEKGFIDTHTKPTAVTRRTSEPPPRHPATPGRELMRWTGAQLEQLFRDNAGHRAVLEALANELRHRTRPRMRNLLRRVEAALRGMGHPAPRGENVPKESAVTGGGAKRAVDAPIEPRPQPCHFCTKEHPESARYCRHCGRRIQRRPSQAPQATLPPPPATTGAAQRTAATISDPRSPQIPIGVWILAALVLAIIAWFAWNMH